MVRIVTIDGEMHGVSETYQHVTELLEDDSKVMHLSAGVMMCFVKANVIFVMDDIILDDLQEEEY